MKMSISQFDLFSHRMPMGIAIFDRELRLQQCNPTWANYIEGYTPGLESVQTGLLLADLLPNAIDVLLPFIHRAFRGETAVEDALRLFSQDSLFYWDAAFSPVIANDAITGVLLVATDVTDRVLTQQLLERHVADRTRKLSALYDVMAVAAEPMGLKQILQQALARVLTAVQAQAGIIQLLNTDQTHLHLVVQQGLPPDVIDELQTIPISNGLFGALVRDWQPIVLKDITVNLEATPALRESDLCAYAGLQMNVKGGMLGVLSVFRQRQRPFNKEDIALLDSVADQIGVAIENARLRKENEQLLVLEERNRLARELHDAVTQSLYSLTLFAEANRRFAEEGDLPHSVEYAALLGNTAQQALREMRLLVHNLRPSILEQAGLVRAIQQRLDGVERRAGIQAVLQTEGVFDLPAHVEEALYHLTQEALNNALKHASATEVMVSLEQDTHAIRLMVQDNGCGFDKSNQDDSGGLGLVSMQERVALLQGELSIETAVNRGTSITVKLNLEATTNPLQDFEALNLL
ncbi:MAG: GAF domain-containing protein [Ardenticatenaceae bacterium]|nr:GAF domain-containing protein [Ardenticatenaceae bacterium]MCB8990826.1 GAF domain-containing protein [Ardenticatenaceae bacterium]MCB9004480.1 GAF domain-containing protein [Ardenticatenaceae bacterium]